jgi:hypothetical protein
VLLLMAHLQSGKNICQCEYLIIGELSELDHGNKPR